MANRATEDHKIWLFDLAHSNLSDTQMLQGFIKYYVLNGFSLANVQDDLIFRTYYGIFHVEQAMKDLKAMLEKVAEGKWQWREALYQVTKKRLTNKEKKQNAEIKRQLQEEGYLPPDKPKLNRQKFVEETEAEWNGRDGGCLVWEVYLMQAIYYMLGHTENDMSMRLSREAVGVAKVLKIAMRLRKFSEDLKSKGEHEYRIIDQYNYIKDILDA